MKKNSLKKTINADKLVSDIEEQTETLSKIIRKFSKQTPEEELPKVLNKKGKFKTNKPQ